MFTFVTCVFNSPAQGSLCFVITVAFNSGEYHLSEVTATGCSFPILPLGIVVVMRVPVAWISLDGQIA